MTEREWWQFITEYTGELKWANKINQTSYLAFARTIATRAPRVGV